MASKQVPTVPEAPAPAVPSPSDLFILESMPWSRQELNGIVRVQVHDVTAHGWDVIERALMVALLANEEAGALRLRLKVVRKDGFFGASTSTTLHATQEDQSPGWPTGSLEEKLREQAAKETRVSDLVYGWIGTDSTNPRAQALQRSMQRCVTKGVLDLESVRKSALKVFKWTSKHYVLPERTAALMERESARLPEARLPETHPPARPEILEQLVGEIRDGFNRRVERNYG